jgi:transposase
MAAAHRGGRHPGKSHPIDAEAVALAALRRYGIALTLAVGEELTKLVLRRR